MQRFHNIDHGKAFDWGKTSKDYAKYRDVYPEVFYQRLYEQGFGKEGQKILDIGTGTGVLPRNMYRFGAKWIGVDLSENQIEQAKILSEGMDIEYQAVAAEDIAFQDDSFDLVTALQCIWYPDHKKLAPKLAKILKEDGSFLIMVMNWLPYEDDLARRSEEIVLKYNPAWTGAGWKRKSVHVPEIYLDYFDIVNRDEYEVDVPFTKEGWHGRIRACRGVGASLNEEDMKKWEVDHWQMLEDEKDEFTIKHYVTSAELKKKGY